MSIVVTSTETDFTNRFNNPITLNKKYKMALTRLETYYSIPNITSENNTFVYNNKTITLPIGTYEIAHINREIQRQLELNDDWDFINKKHYIEIGANTATLCCYIYINNSNISVKMDQSTIRTVLGFSSRVLQMGYHESDGIVNIMPVNSIMVNCDIVGGSYVNESERPVIYSFFPDANPGYKIIEIPRQLIYLPVIAPDRISTIRIWLTDQDGKLINLRGEKLTINFHLVSI